VNTIHGIHEQIDFHVISLCGGRNSCDHFPRDLFGERLTDAFTATQVSADVEGMLRVFLTAAYPSWNMFEKAPSPSIILSSGGAALLTYGEIISVVAHFSQCVVFHDPMCL
jgi:hypothetical protein